MKTLALWMIVMMACAAVAGDIILAWDPPTNNTDGTPLTDLAGYNVYYSSVVVAYRESNNVMTWAVLSTGTYGRVYTTNTQLALTLPSTVYNFYVTAVAGLGAESEPSSNLMCRVGSVSTVKMVRRK
jgi:hypothetical protein